MINKEKLDGLMTLLEANSKGYVASDDESIVVEYKVSFDWKNSSERTGYIKAMAGFAMRSGGFLVFGINKESKVEGIDEVQFRANDIDEINKEVHNYFQPSFEIDRDVIDLNGMKCGVFYVKEAEKKPLYCIKDSAVLKNGDVYLRYPGSTKRILPGDMENIIQQRAGQINDNQSATVLKNIRRNDIKPIFISAGTQFGNDIKLILRNIGGRARVLDVESVDGVQRYLKIQQGFIDKNVEINIFTHGVEKRNLTDIQAVFYYLDDDGRKYKQQVIQKGTNACTVNDAELVKDTD